MEKRPNVVPAGLPPRRSVPRQMNMTFNPVELQGMSSAQRTRAITHLANLLMQAAGVGTAKEHDDNER